MRALALGLAAAFVIGCGGGDAEPEVGHDTTSSAAQDALVAAGADASAPHADMGATVDTLLESDPGPPPPLEPPALRDPEAIFPAISPGATGVQPAPAFGPTGDLLVAWSGSEGDLDLTIWLSRFDPNLKSQGAPRRVDAAADGSKNEPAMCALGDGGFAVAWSVDAQRSGGTLEARVRTLGTDGTPLGTEEHDVRTAAEGNHWLADLACGGDGFVVAAVLPDPDETFGVFVQRFDGAGAPIGEPILAHDDPTGTQAFPAVAMDDDGIAIVAWDDSQPDDDTNIDTVQATRIPLNGGHGPIWTLGGGVGVAAKGVDAASHGPTGTYAFAFMLDEARIELMRLEPTDVAPARWPGWTPIDGLVPAVTFLERPDRLLLVWISREDGGGALHLRVLDADGAILDQFRTATTSFVPFKTELAARDGRIAVGYTDRAEAGAQPGARLLRFAR